MSTKWSRLYHRLCSKQAFCVYLQHENASESELSYGDTAMRVRHNREALQTLARRQLPCNLTLSLGGIDLLPVDRLAKVTQSTVRVMAPKLSCVCCLTTL